MLQKIAHRYAIPLDKFQKGPLSAREGAESEAVAVISANNKINFTNSTCN